MIDACPVKCAAYSTGAKPISLGINATGPQIIEPSLTLKIRLTGPRFQGNFCIFNIKIDVDREWISV
jgi:hypothetical protein